MAEESSTPQGEGGPDPVALGAAISRSSPSVDAELVAYLHDQRHHLHEQLKQLHLGMWEKWLGVLLRVATAVMGLAVAGTLGLMVWQAARSNGLRVEPFSVPPDLAAHGLTGEVVAARVIDRLNLMQSQTNTARPARSYSNAWGEHGIKLEIPETGVSLAELDNWLRQKLGHDIGVSGEIVRTATGITLTARAGEEGTETISGPDADIDVLVAKMAEAIYRITQPYRYAVYLLRHENRAADALPIFKSLALNGSPDDRLWSYNMWAVTDYALVPDGDAYLRLLQQALAADPEAIGVYTNLYNTQRAFGRYEEFWQTIKDLQAHLTDGKQRYVPADEIPAYQKRFQAVIDRYFGAYHDALPLAVENVKTGVPGNPFAAVVATLIATQYGEHDIAAARNTLANFLTGSDANRAAWQIAFAAQDWKGALASADEFAAILKTQPRNRRYMTAQFAPQVALVQAQLGDFAAAEKTIAPTESDCYPCLIARAQIAELQGQRPRADFWFARADAAAPSFPFAFEAEGRALLARGKPGEAIERFTLANQKSPHFADAIEGRGEALLAKNDARAAAEKFAEAEKYAPNWGRLHLKWGMALAAAGKGDEARAQFARAVQLDLTPDEKSELIKVRHG